MTTRFHAAAGGLAMGIILIFWSSSVIAELFLSHETVAVVKEGILRGLILLIPAMAITGGSGFHLAKGRTGALITGKQKRMRILGANGLLVLLPCAFYLHHKASSGQFDPWFYGVQLLELLAGVLQLALMGANFRAGLTLTRRSLP
ncbi:MAG: hypothetical protein HQL95_02025 [Magnetococcales bacterium]|nr:hypothetical protein [Magnetococcales bacterium]